MTRHRLPFIVAGVFFASVIGLAVATEPDGTTQTRPPASSAQTDHDLLQRDAEMTQRMGVPGTPGAMEQGRVVDEQLRHSHSAGFVTGLEAHQAEIDRMLARDDR